MSCATSTNGLRSMESPDYGGWGGRYVSVRNNVWIDPLPDSTFMYPVGQWGFGNSFSKKMEKDTAIEKVRVRTTYFKPIWRWLKDVQNDFAARADWCVKDYKSANHHPIVMLKNTPLNITARAGEAILLDASDSNDPDGDQLRFKWWHYAEAGTYKGEIPGADATAKMRIVIPEDAKPGQTIHMICQMSDSGEPILTRYQRVIITIKSGN